MSTLKRRTELKRTRIRNATIRTLRPDEEIPQGRPRRYIDGRGYVRLRWLVAPQTYVEEYEHRIVCGRPDPSLDVHHLNGDKADNRPENLLVLTRSEHARLHQDTYRAEGRFQGSRRTRAAAERRASKDARNRAMADDYRSGLNTLELGEKYGLSPSQVSRLLRQVGVRTRAGRGGTSPRTPIRQQVQSRAGLRCERCGTGLVYAPHHVHHRRPRGMGGSSDPSTNRPPNLVLLCVACHEHVESNRATARADGWLVPQGTDSGEVPVVLHDGRRVLLTDDGTYLEVPR